MGRPGDFLAVPRELWREADRVLTSAQFKVLFALLAEANYTRGEVSMPDGGRVALDVGEVLVGGRSFALRHGLGHKAVRVALKRLQGLGWINLRSAIEEGTGEGTPPDRERAQVEGTPPSIVRVNVYRGILWPASKEGTPPGHAVGHTPQPQEGTIQQGSIQQGQEEAFAADAASPPSQPDVVPPATREEPPMPKPRDLVTEQLFPGGSQAPPVAPPTSKRKGDPRHAPLVERLVAIFAELRGTPYAFGGGKDARAVTRLLALGSDSEIEARWRNALARADRWEGFLSLANLPGHWNEVSAPPVRLGPDGRPLKTYGKTEVPEAWG